MHQGTTRRRGSARRAPALLAGLTSSLVASMLAGAAHAAPTQAAPTPAKTDLFVARTLAARPASGWSSVILKTTGALTPTQEARLHSLGADVTRRLPLIGSVAVRVPSRSLGKLAALPFVTHVSLDGTVQKSDDFTVGSSEANQAVAMTTGKKSTPYQLTGKGVTVAVVDSGVTPLPDLSSQSGDFYGQAPSRLLGGVNFANTLPSNGQGGVTYTVTYGSGQVSLVNNGNSFDPCGHGTHIAGIIAGNGSRSPGQYCTDTYYGIAPQASLVSVRVLDQNGQASVSGVVAGLAWAVAHQNDNRNAPIRVLNLSLGHPVGDSYANDPLCQAVEAVWKAGIVVVCAAGNGGRFGTVNLPSASNEGWGTAYGSIQSPANDPYVITVGATKSTDGVRADDRIATYSGRGPSRLDLVLKPDIIAPGNKVISLDAGGSALDMVTGGSNNIPYSLYVQSSLGISGTSGDYFRLSGTSMAAPVVAGAAALLLQADPTLTPDTVKARLMLSADKWATPNGTGDALTYGAGYLDIPAALASTAKAGLPALSPTLMLNADGTISLVMDRAAWGSTLIDGSRVAWGSGLWGTGLTDLRAAWGSSVGSDRAAWGSVTNPDGSVSLFMDRAAWGSTSLAADRAAWGSAFTAADRAAWGSSSPSVDLTSTALAGE